MKVVAVISMLHEPARGHSAEAGFRGRPVLDWTLARLERMAARPAPAVACWDDQLEAMRRAAGDRPIVHLQCGPRVFQLGLEAVSAAQRWCDGWRGGLLGTCWFDRGFHGPSVRTAVESCGADAALLVDPSAGLIDPDLTDALLRHAAEHPDRGIVFSQAAPGLCGVLLRRELVLELDKLGTHPGRALHYVPDHYAHDPIATPACAPAPAPVCRSLGRFLLDSPRQLRRMERITQSLNGQLISAGAEELVELAGRDAALSELPRDLVLELTTRRNTRAIFRPEPVAREELPAARWLPLLDQIAGTGTRLTLAGLGDPMLYRELEAVLEGCRARGIPLSIETDLLGVEAERIEAVARSSADVLLVHLPGAGAETYRAVMGVDGLASVGAGVERFVRARHPRATPIFVPCFVKLRQNLGEMEAWYDHYLKAAGSAVIEGATTWAGTIEDHAPSDISPPRRGPCRRLWSRMSVRSDGGVGMCEYDFGGEGSRGIGSVLETPLAELWREGLEAARRAHRDVTGKAALPGRPAVGSPLPAASGAGSQRTALPVAGLPVTGLPVTCESCREWHRP